MRHLKIYRAIRLIQKTGSIRKAAELLAISPSALNRSVQGFEEELGLPVFDRMPAGVRLTTAGELLLGMLDRHLTEFDDFRAQISGLRDGLGGVLRLSLGSDICAGLPLAAIRDVEAAFPRLSIEISTDDTLDPLQRRDADLAILTDPVTDDTVEVVHTHRIRVLAFLPADGGVRPAGLWDLADRRVLLPPEGTGARAAISHALRRARLELPTASALSAGQLRDQLRGAGRVALFPETILDPETPSPLEPLHLPLGTVHLSALRASRIPMTRTTQAFLMQLQRRLDPVVEA
jgi:DNA-binding transcriptional LysR family regulator